MKLLLECVDAFLVAMRDRRIEVGSISLADHRWLGCGPGPARPRVSPPSRAHLSVHGPRSTQQCTLLNAPSEHSPWSPAEPECVRGDEVSGAASAADGARRHLDNAKQARSLSVSWSGRRLPARAAWDLQG
jgi:hypothetical protein